MPLDVTYENLLPNDKSAYEDLYNIYAESIPHREQKTRAEIAAMVKRPDYHVLLVKRKGRTIGFSIVFVPTGESFALLEYMAVHAAHRGAGLGAELFRRTVQMVANERGDVPLLLEVDSDREVSADRVNLQKRKIFYRKLGCLQIDKLHYVLSLQGHGPPPEMDLMICLPENLRPVRKSHLERWLRVIYERVYNRSPDDPRIIEMMKSVTDPVSIV